MKFKLFFIIFFAALNINAQQVDLKSFTWNLSSDTISVNEVDPSDVYLALLSKGIIEEPFYRDNEKKLQWVGKRDWVFETEFKMPKHIRNREKIEMVFEGLDTYASVYLNDQLILKADNMFRTRVVDVKPFLKKSNRIRIIFKSPLKVIAEAKEKGEWKLPYDYGYVRKAPYHFGWDWGPTFITCGIWRPAYIRAWDNARLEDVFVEQKSVDKNLAVANVIISVDVTQERKGELWLYRSGLLIEKLNVDFKPGKNKFTIPDKINNPDLWWPNGLGTPYLYQYKVKLVEAGTVLDSMKVETGFRTVEVIQKPDSTGSSFFFKINGVPVFAKGANYIPPDNFLPRVSDDKYIQIITNARKANMNMLRVWGGGTYEKDIFYRLCDENGIMVWQDFMFACNMNPGDAAFMKNVKEEAKQNVLRLRNHPSIVLWCGNNEVDEAWHNWGWQKKYHYSVSDSSKLWKAYTNLFETVLPDVVKKYSPQSFYWPSSPSIGWGHKEAFRQGDVHYWEVWWGKAPFENYEKKIGRFVSEYGFQGMPDMKTIDAFTLPEDRKQGSKVLNVHQKHPFGWEAINEYMQRDFTVPDNIDDYDYVSQLLQAKGIGMAIEAHRRAKPYCMGTLYWQLNDCWPVVSWSSFDYYGRWKALHYRVKKDFAPFLVSFDKTADSVRIWVVSDEPKTQKANLQWTLNDFYGKILASGSKHLEIESGSSFICCKLSKRMIEEYDSASIVLNAVLLKGDSLLAENNYCFTAPKNLKLIHPELSVEMDKSEGGYKIFISSDKYAKGVQLSTAVSGFFEDNYFDLLSGETKEILFKTNEPFYLNKLNIKTLYDVVH